ncbi:uncharacterized protein LOC107265902 [Cephus cinctus]|uniref:Uncharacterized protein LOC107265902 n=1 Tax=Cephus cinctus TaxID=211228 RepID=A0AAJ7BPL8_CEPCN|nr:uncharacterized protein LOC107265902 [Cephus cinctus]
MSSELSIVKYMDETIFEQICDAIFTLIPEVPRLKQLFLSWSLLNFEEKQQLDEKVKTWYNPSRRQLYKPLREALIRWENLQDTQGAPGCEPGLVSFSCDPQLEEELVNVICSLEIIFAKNKEGREDEENKGSQHARPMAEIPMSNKSTPKDRTPHSVHSCGYITDRKDSDDDDMSGYMTN